MLTVVGVHGIWNYDRTAASPQDAARTLSERWTRALSSHLGNERQVDVRITRVLGGTDGLNFGVEIEIVLHAPPARTAP